MANILYSVPQNAATLVFSFIGMKKMEIDIGGRSVIDVIMESDILGLDEVVVTALGISREKKSLGYSVQEVRGDNISKTKESNFVNSLSGKVSGVQIKQSNTMGGSANILIRGNKSLMNNNQALFVVDGVPLDNSIPNTTLQVNRITEATIMVMPQLISIPMTLNRCQSLREQLLLLCMAQGPLTESL